MAMSPETTKLVQEAASQHPVQHGPIGELPTMPWPTSNANQTGSIQAPNADAMHTDSARAAKRNEAQLGDEKTPTEAASLGKDGDDEFRTSQDSKRRCHTAVSISPSEEDNPWKDLYVVSAADKGFSDEAVFDEKKLEDPEFVMSVKQIVEKYCIDFDKWKVGITVHKANCLDFALADLRVQLGIEIVLVPPKVKEETEVNALDDFLAVGSQPPAGGPESGATEAS